MPPACARSPRLLVFLLLGCSAPAAPPPPAPQPAPVAPAPQVEVEVAQAEARPATAPTATVREGEAGPLRYLEVIPAGVDPDAVLPIVVFIHGLGDRPRTAFVDGVQLRARFILPQAPTAYGGGFSWFPYRVGEQHPEFSGGIERAAGQLVEMLKVLRGRLPTRGLPIVAGFSQGGILSFAVALHYPSEVLAAHPISGMLPPELWPQAPEAGVAQPPIRALHGDADTVVSFAAAEATVTALAGRGFDISLQRFEGVGHTQTLAMRAVMEAQLQTWLARVQSAGAAGPDPR